MASVRQTLTTSRRTGLRIPVDKMHSLARTLCGRLPEISGREAALQRALVFEARRRNCGPDRRIPVMVRRDVTDGSVMGRVMMGRGAERITNASGQILAREAPRFPEVVVGAVQAVGRSLGQEITRDRIVAALLLERDIAAELLEQGVTAEEAAVPDRLRNHVLNIIRGGLGVRGVDGKPLNSVRLAAVAEAVGRKISAPDVATRPSGQIFIPDLARERGVARRYAAEYRDFIPAEKYIRETMFPEVMLAAIRGRAEIAVFNELHRWYLEYADFLAHAQREGRAGDNEYWKDFEAAFYHFFTRLKILERVIGRDGRLRKGDMVFPRSFAGVKREVANIIRDDLLRLDAAGSKSVDFMVLPEAIVLNSDRDYTAQGEVEINGVKYDVSRFGQCVVIPFKHFARVYSLRTGQRRAEFSYPCSSGFIHRLAPVTVRPNGNFSCPLEGVVLRDHVRVAEGVYLHFRCKNPAPGESSIGEQAVFAHEMVSVYDPQGRFVGAVNPRILGIRIRKVSPLEVQFERPGHKPLRIKREGKWKDGIPGINVAELLVGLQYRDLIGRRLLGRRELEGRRRGQVATMKINGVKYMLARQHEIDSPQVVYQDLRVSPYYPWQVAFVYGRAWGKEAHQLIGIFRLRDLQEFKRRGDVGQSGVVESPLVSFEDLVREVPELGARGSKLNRETGGTRVFLVDNRILAAAPLVPPEIFAQPMGRGRIEFRTTAGLVGAAQLAEDERQLSFGELGRRVPGLFPEVVEVGLDAGGVLAYRGDKYATDQIGAVFLHLRPEDGVLPFIEVMGKGRAVLEVDPGESGVHSYVAPLFEPFAPVAVENARRLYVYPSGGRRQSFLIPQNLFDAGLRYARALSDGFLFVGDAEERVYYAATFAEMLAANDMGQTLRLPVAVGLPPDLTLSDVNRLYRILHAAGVRIGDKRESRFTLNQLVATLRFMRGRISDSEETMIYLLQRCGRYLIYALEMEPRK